MHTCAAANSTFTLMKVEVEVATATLLTSCPGAMDGMAACRPSSFLFPGDKSVQVRGSFFDPMVVSQLVTRPTNRTAPETFQKDSCELNDNSLLQRCQTFQL